MSLEDKQMPEAAQVNKWVTDPETNASSTETSTGDKITFEKNENGELYQVSIEYKEPIALIEVAKKKKDATRVNFIPLSANDTINKVTIIIEAGEENSKMIFSSEKGISTTSEFLKVPDLEENIKQTLESLDILKYLKNSPEEIRPKNI